MLCNEPWCVSQMKPWQCGVSKNRLQWGGGQPQGHTNQDPILETPCFLAISSRYYTAMVLLCFHLFVVPDITCQPFALSPFWKTLIELQLCEYTEWHWMHCEDFASCSTENATATTQSRYRTIIQRSANGGQECPDTLYEERECESLPVCPVYR